MDAKHFDRLAKAFVAASTRRGLLHILSTLPLVGGLASLFAAEGADAKGRRKRRKKRHKHGKGRRRKHQKKCKPNSLAKTCTNKCGPVQNNCKKTVDCGSCACDPPCGACETCTDDLTCEACEPCCDEVCCAQASAICDADSGACCVPDSMAQTCNNQCGDVADNCGLTVDCGPCRCDGGCPVCQICDEETGGCVPDPNQQGDDCGEPGQVCQSDGSCACDATSCPPPETCGGGGEPNVCGCTAEDPCGPASCGERTDNCGNTVDCGGCTPPEMCRSGTCRTLAGTCTAGQSTCQQGVPLECNGTPNCVCDVTVDGATVCRGVGYCAACDGNDDCGPNEVCVACPGCGAFATACNPLCPV